MLPHLGLRRPRHEQRSLLHRADGSALRTTAPARLSAPGIRNGTPHSVAMCTRAHRRDGSCSMRAACCVLARVGATPRLRRPSPRRTLATPRRRAGAPPAPGTQTRALRGGSPARRGGSPPPSCGATPSLPPGRRRSGAARTGWTARGATTCGGGPRSAQRSTVRQRRRNMAVELAALGSGIVVMAAQHCSNTAMWLARGTFRCVNLGGHSVCPRLVPTVPLVPLVQD